MEPVSLTRVFISLLFVLGLIGLFAALAKRFGLPQKLAGSARAGTRLAIVETLLLDAKRRLVLIRRDGTLHLLLLGGGSDVVIESGIADEEKKEHHA